ALGRGEAPAGSVRGTASSTKPKVAFLFTDQSAQYASMDHRLYETQPVFRKALEKCAELLAPELERPLLAVLYPKEGEASPIDATGYTQPALFALEYALAQLWQSWGIQPDAVIGHSVGEIAAACVAGVFSLEDGLKLIAARGRLMQALPAGGAMVSLRATEERVRAAIAAYPSSVSLAALNAPEQVVISGAEGDVLSVAQALAKEGVETKRLTVSHAFHSPLMAPMVE